MGRHAREMYDRFEQMIGECGEYRIAPAKSRIAFLGVGGQQHAAGWVGMVAGSERGLMVGKSGPR